MLQHDRQGRTKVPCVCVHSQAQGSSSGAGSAAAGVLAVGAPGCGRAAAGLSPAAPAAPMLLTGSISTAASETRRFQAHWGLEWTSTGRCAAAAQKGHAAASDVGCAPCLTRFLSRNFSLAALPCSLEPLYDAPTRLYPTALGSRAADVPSGPPRRRLAACDVAGLRAGRCSPRGAAGGAAGARHHRQLGCAACGGSPGAPTAPASVGRAG